MEDTDVAVSIYNFEKVTPEMSGTLNYWAKFLNMGVQNLRFAMKKGKLHAVKQALSEKNPDFVGWIITGQDILNWRANMHVATGTGGKKVANAWKFKTSAALTMEDAQKINDALKAAGFDVTLVKPEFTGKKKDPVATVNEGSAPAEIDLTAIAAKPANAVDEKPAGGFGIFGRK
jgi:hypothetical protein